MERASDLLWPDVGRTNDRGPVLSFVSHQPGEVGGGTRQDRVAEVCKLRLHPRIGESTVNLRV
jgi:hypothetical protein